MDNKNFIHINYTLSRKEAEFIHNLLMDYREKTFEDCCECDSAHRREWSFPDCKNCKYHIPHVISILDDELRDFLFPSEFYDPIDDDMPF